MLITTTNSIDNQTIKEYLGIISSELVTPSSDYKNIFKSLKDSLNYQRNETVEQIIKKSKTLALDEITAAAKEKGADAILGLKIDYEIKSDSGYIIVACYGTAVTFA